MPGLTQLKEFSKDLLSLGDEITLRAARGEKPVKFDIPNTIADEDDSEEFVLGMPEKELETEQEIIDEDLSELTGLSTASTQKKSENTDDAATAFAAPDMSDLLAPMGGGDGSDGADMPDLSMFMDEPEEAEPEVEEEPEEVSLADMSLEDLLAGGGFDEPQEDEESEEAEEVEDAEDIEDVDEIEDAEAADLNDAVDLDQPADLDEPEELEDAADLDEPASLDGAGELDEAGNLDLPDNLFDARDLDMPEDLSDAAADLDMPEELSDAAATLDLPEDLGDATGDLDLPEDLGAATDLDLPEDLGDATDDLDLPEDLGEATGDLDLPEDLSDATAGLDLPEDLSDATGGLDLPEDMSDATAGLDLPEDLGDTTGNLDLPEDLGDATGDLDLPEDLGEATGDLDLPEDLGEATNLDLPEDLGDATGDLDLPEDLGDATGDLDLPEDLGDATGGLDLPEDLSDTTGDLDLPGDLGAATGDLDLPEDLGTATDLDLPEDLSDATAGLDLPEDLGEATGNLDLPKDLSDATDNAAASDDKAAAADTFGIDDLGFDNFDFSSDEAEKSEESSEPEDDSGLEPVENENADEDSAAEETGDNSEADALSGLGDLSDLGSLDLDDAAAAPEVDATEEISDSPDLNVDLDAFDTSSDFDTGADFDNAGDFDSEENPESVEVFDTSDIADLDFGIADTDDQLGGGSDFELGSSDDFAMEGEFEIPGFSDVDTAKEEKKSKPLASGKGKKGKGKNLPEPDFSNAEESETLPPNTLSDEQYKVFLKNLNEYPLNVRLAFEDLIVQDEFTEDAEFEIIEKILNKAPARQVAGMLEKMLDTSIPVPRDFEHRTADEYEAYKKSLSYQLRNKIIPAALVGMVALLVLWGLFNFSKNCIYKPLKANSLYKQGYALLEADEYPQSEMKFNEAVKYRISKKWFFNYARGYRQHKQYQRAGTMYQNILKCFRHDKPAGLEYADMELNDMANYPRAEEIVRREVLDYHINDKDGILMLGDIFLEWATDKDPSKFELAREQYATLIQLYEPSDLYKSRMMRYFIRTDNLREVLQLKPDFENRDKSLCAEDWAELSGYLLDKYYGPMDPSEEYLRYEIEGLRGLLLKAVKSNPENPIAYYNLAKYFINTNEIESIEATLQRAIEKFNLVPSMKNRDVYKYIDSYRLLGEHYMDTTDYLQAQEQFAEGISLYTTERDNAGFAGTPSIGKLYEDMGNIKYSISGDYDEALLNYKYSVELENDSPSLRYRIGYIQYKNKNYLEALGAFMKAGDGNIKERNLQLAMANTLFLRGDDYAAEGYYNQLIDNLDAEIAEQGIVFPQTSVNDYDTVNTYLYAANNYGVTLYHLAKRTGDSALNAQSIVQFSQSVRAWDALTRNQDTLLRLPGSNLAEQNIKYITSPIPNYEPSIYIEIPRTLTNNERL